MVCRQWIVRGRVQGVGYRAATRQQAQLLGLCGHARNRSDGAVEVLAYGLTAAVEALELWLWQGPAVAQVQSVTLQELPAPTQPPHAFTLG
ncbi:MAG: acylphosphatase [Dyella sp.]